MERSRNLSYRHLIFQDLLDFFILHKDHYPLYLELHRFGDLIRLKERKTLNEKVLIVEDQVLISMAQELVLKKAGYDVTSCINGERAVDSVKNDAGISLVLMDIDLGPGIDGTEAAKEILKIRDLPIIFLTSHTEREMVEKVKGISRYGYVIKDSGDFVLLESISMAFELHKARKELQKSELKYREIVENNDDAIIEFDEENRILFFSRGAEKIFGYKADEVLGKKSCETINPVTDSYGNDHRQLIRHIFNNTMKYERNQNENVTKDGRRLWMEWMNKMVCDKAGKPLYLLCIGRDVTEKRRVEDELAYKSGFFQAVFHQAPSMILITTLDEGRVIDANECFFENLGYLKEDLIGRKTVESGVIEPAVRGAYISTLEKEGQITDYELYLKDKRGRPRRCICNAEVFDHRDETMLLTIARPDEA